MRRGVFWKRKPDRQTVAESPTAVFEPLRIYAPNAIIDGWVPAPAQRLSDTLNLAETLTVSRAAGPTDADWFEVDRDQMLLVAPPPQLTAHLRQHRVKRPILVRRGHYVVQGRVHMIAGIALDPHLARTGRYFLAVTDAWVTSSAMRDLDARHPDLLVNVRSTIGRLDLEVDE